MEQRILDIAAAAGVQLPSDGASRLAGLAELLSTVGVEAGVISPGDGPVALERHVLDSLRAATFVDEMAYDLGSGGGLPGLVLAIAQPEMTVWMVDRRRRKIGFIELCLQRLAITNGSAVLSEIDKIDAPAPLCFARALAPPERSWEFSLPLLRPGGRLVYFAGKGFQAPEGLPELVSCETVRADFLESAGPLAIMTRT